MSDPATTPTTDDAFLGGALQMLQPQNSYRAGLDAVLLAAAASILPGAGARVLDVGAGVGVVGLAVAWPAPTSPATNCPTGHASSKPTCPDPWAS